MMARLVEILTGVGILIGIFLIVSHGAESAKIINAIGMNSVNGIKTLQGR